MISPKLEGFSRYLGEPRFIPGYDEDYAVTSLGFVISFKKKTKLIKSNKLTSGYLAYHLYMKDKRTVMTGHRLVLLVFMGPKPKGYEIDHSDNNRWNNSLTNLSYVTHTENMKQQTLRREARGQVFHTSKLTPETVLLIYHSKLRLKEAAEKYGTTDKNISAIRRGVTWSWVTGATKK